MPLSFSTYLERTLTISQCVIQPCMQFPFLKVVYITTMSWMCIHYIDTGHVYNTVRVCVCVHVCVAMNYTVRSFSASIWSARVESSVSLRTLTSDSHVTATPFPAIHSCKILHVIVSDILRQSFFNGVHSTARLVIEKEDPKHVVVSTDLLRYFETKLL